MNEFQLKYGTNPNQKPARIYMADGSDLPVTILNGRPGYINFLDAFNSYQLVRDLRLARKAGNGAAVLLVGADEMPLAGNGLGIVEGLALHAGGVALAGF